MRASPRLLIATTAPQTLLFMLPYARHFRDRGWTVDAAARGVTEYAPVAGHFSALHDVPWERTPFSPANYSRAAPRFRSLVAANRYDLVHVHTPVAAFVGRLALAGLRPHKPRVVYTAHGFHFHSSGRLAANVAYAAAELLAGQWTDHLVVMNHEDLEAARRLRILPRDRITYMPGIGIDVADWSRAAATPSPDDDVRRELAIPPGARVAIMIAEFIARKRHRDLIAAFASAPRDAYLVLVGAGPLRADAERQARELGIGDRVRFAGLRRDVPRLLRSATVSVLPSSQEGLPRVIMESMALGVPVIASDVRGNRDLLADGAGLLFPLGDTAALAHHLEHVLTDSSFATAVAAKGLEAIKAYDVSITIAAHEKLYEALLADRAHASAGAPA